MKNFDIYEDIATRTKGALYVGVVGPVRTGKSTFIKRFLETLVLPAFSDAQAKQMRDELPQSANGKTIMTTEPKFVPAEPVGVRIGEKTEAKVRLIDCVGFLVEGAQGATEEGEERLVSTPWSPSPMPFEEAAKTGTEKVIRDHSSVAVLVTTDGSIADIPRENYVPAEEKTVKELKELSKPFVILLNCRDEKSEQARALQAQLKEKYAAAVLAVNVEKMREEDFISVFEGLLFEFPVCGIEVGVPEWVQTLPAENPIVAEIMEKLRAVAPKIEKMRDCDLLSAAFEESENLSGATEVGLNLSKGEAECTLGVKEGVFYRVLSEECGEEIAGDADLLGYVCALAADKKKYDRIRGAFERAEQSGYGVVPPDGEQMRLTDARVLRQGSNFGVSLRAQAPSYHVLKVDVSSCVNPLVGSEKQGEEFAENLVAEGREDEKKLWDTEVFGRTLGEMARDGLSKKSGGMSENLQRKMQRTLRRIVNDGRGNILCILL